MCANRSGIRSAVVMRKHTRQPRGSARNRHTDPDSRVLHINPPFDRTDVERVANTRLDCSKPLHRRYERQYDPEKRGVAALAYGPLLTKTDPQIAPSTRCPRSPGA